MRHRSRGLPNEQIVRKRIHEEGDKLLKIFENKQLVASSRVVEFVLDFPFPFTYDAGAYADGLMRETGVV
jgi:hypothetical protein